MRLQKFLEHVLANGLTFKVKETKKTILIESYSEEKLKLDSWISMNKFYSYDDAESTLKGLIDEDEYESGYSDGFQDGIEAAESDNDEEEEDED